MKKKTGQKTEPTPQQLARRKYEAEKRGKVMMRVQLSIGDSEEEWEAIKKDFIGKYKSTKEAIKQLHKKAKEDGLFDT